MTGPGKPKRATHNRIIRLFRDELNYRYLGDWTDREGANDVKLKYLTAYLAEQGYTVEQIDRANQRLRPETSDHSRSLYGNNQAVYELLRYGVQIRTDASRLTEPST